MLKQLPLVLGGLALASLALGLTGAVAPQGVEPGETVTYTFRTPPLESRGVTSLDDLRGKPVVVEFWGTR